MSQYLVRSFLRAQLCKSKMLYILKSTERPHMLSLSVTLLQVKHLLHICFKKLVPIINNAFHLKHLPLCWKHKTLKIRGWEGNCLQFAVNSSSQHALYNSILYNIYTFFPQIMPQQYIPLHRILILFTHFLTFIICKEFSIYLFPQSCNLPLPYVKMSSHLPGSSLLSHVLSFAKFLVPQSCNLLLPVSCKEFSFTWFLNHAIFSFLSTWFLSHAFFKVLSVVKSFHSPGSLVMPSFQFHRSHRVLIYLVPQSCTFFLHRK